MLAKDEVRVFISRAVQDGIFTDFFRQQDQKEQAAVDALYEEIFLDAFLSHEDDGSHNGMKLSKSVYENVVRQKLSDDQQLRNSLINNFDKVDKANRGYVTEAQVKGVLLGILRQQIKKLTDAVDSDEDADGFDGDTERQTNGM